MTAAPSNDDLVISISTDTTELVNAQKNAAKQVVSTLATIEKAAIQAGLKIDNAFIDAGKEIEKGIGEGSKKANTALKTLNNALAKQTQELARVKTLYPQAGQAVERYEAAVASLAKSFTAGDTTARQFQNGIERERQALLINTAEVRRNQNAIIARNKAAATPVPRIQQPANNNIVGAASSASGFQTANIAAQFQDIAVTAAMGMSPLQIALQQGTQLSSVLTTMGNGRQVITGLASAFGSLISPVSLVTIGLIAGGTALAQYLMSGKDNAKELEKILKDHEQNISDIRQTWGDAAKALDEYNKKTPLEIRVDAKINQDNLIAQLKRQGEYLASGAGGIFQSATADIEDKIRSLSAALSTETDQSKIKSYYDQLFKLNGSLEDAAKAAPVAGDKFSAFKSEIDAFGKTIQAGNPQVVNFAKSIRERIDADPASQEIRKLGGELLSLIEKLEDTGKALGQNATSFDVTKKNIELTADQTKRLADEAERYKEAMISVVAISKLARPPQSELEQIEERYNEAIVKGRGNKNVEYAAIRERDAAIKRYQSQFIINADGNRTTVPVPGQRPNRESQEPDKSLKKQQTAAEKAKKAYENLLTSVNNRNDLLRLEIDLQGQAAVATDVARTALETLQKAQKAGVTGENLEKIKREVAVYQQLADTLAKTKLSQDLAGQNYMASLSSDDYRVAQMLKQYGLSPDLNSREANQIREFNSQQDRREEISSFLSDLKGGVVASGGDVGKAFGETFRNALLNQADKIWDNLFKQIASAVIGGNSQKSAAGAGALGLGASTVSRLTSSMPVANQNGSSVAAQAVLSGNPLGFIGNYKSGVDNRLTDILQTAAQRMPGYKVDAISGLRPGDKRFHGQGLATDVQLTDLLSGKKLGNYQDASSFRTYEQFAQEARRVQMEKYPELSEQFRWGGYFGGGKGKYGALDTMHFDLAGDKVGMGGGSWQNGLTQNQTALWPGVTSQGMSSAAQAIDQLTTASTGASKELSGMGNILGNVGQQVNLPTATPATTPPIDASGLSQLSSGIEQMLASIGSGLGGLLSKILGGGGAGFLGLLGFAEGGHVSGPGTSKSDSIPAMLSNGEYVVNASQTKKHRALLEAINSGSMLFRADGGYVAPKVASAPVAPTLRPRMGTSNENNRNPGVLQVHITGASGDAHIRELVKEGVGSGLSTYNIQQARGGQGVLEAQYQKRKG